jgi:hypothetical protein
MDDLLNRCPVGSLVFTDHCGRCACGCEVILVGWWGCEASVQEDLSFVVPPSIYPVRAWY